MSSYILTASVYSSASYEDLMFGSDEEDDDNDDTSFSTGKVM